MKNIYILLISIVLLTLFATQSFSQGETCNTAEEIIINGLYSADGPTSGGGATNGTADNADWYSFTAPANGTIDISSCDLDGVDTRLFVYDGSCAALNQIANDDDGCGPQWESLLEDIAVTTGQTYYIEWDDKWAPTPFQFNFTFTAYASCMSPVELSAINVTTASATLTWIEVASASLWDLEYGLAGFTQGTGTTITGLITNSYDVSGLALATAYDFYVRADCGGGDLSSWSDVGHFSTSCITINTFPYDENFDNDYVVPDCWENLSSNDYDWTFQTSSFAIIGDHTTGSGFFAYFDSYGSGAGDIGIIKSPVFDITGLSEPYLSFWYNRPESGGSSRIIVNILSDGVWYNDIIPGLNQQTVAWTEVGISLDPYVSDNMQVYFKAVSDTWHILGLDDMKIDVAPVCPNPSSLSASNVEDVSAMLNWLETGSASTWNIEWGPIGFTQGSGTMINDVDTNPYQLNGLTQETAYAFFVQSDCGDGDYSSWIGPMDFTTIIPPITNPSVCELQMSIPPGNSSCLDVYINVNGLYGTSLGDGVFVENVNIIIDHNQLEDISFSLTSPNLVTTEICYWGGNGQDFGIVDGTCTEYTTFNMTGMPIFTGTAPYLGEYQPDTPFDNWNDGSDPNGMWRLRICDNMGGPTGTLEFFEITFNDMIVADVVINEVDCKQESDTLEFIELYDGGIGNFPLMGKSIVLFDGETDQSYYSIDLDGYQTNAEGYFVIANADIANADMVFADGLLQNGADAVALYEDLASSFPNGTIITTNNLLDVLVYETDDPTDIQLISLLNVGQPQINENILNSENTHSCSRLPNGSGGLRNSYTYNAAIPTPGEANQAVPELVWSELVFTEVLSNDGSISNDIYLELNNDSFVSVGVLVETTDYIINNLPAGLNIEIEILTDSTAIVSLIGNAENHLNVDDVNSLEISFTNAVFNIFSVDYILNSSILDIYIDFFDAPPPTLVWISDTFNESAVNDGSISNSISIELTSETFISTGIITDYTYDNLPTGLDIEVNVVDETNAEISLIGNAVAHDEINDISILEISFIDAAFTSGNASELDGATNSNLIIDFVDIPSGLTDILLFSFVEQTGAASIDAINHTVEIEVALGTDLTSLIPTYTLSTGAHAFVLSVEQISSVTENDYSSILVYNVVAENGTDNQDWDISVSIVSNILTNNISKNLYIYPNPADNSFTLEFNQNQKSDIIIQIYNLNVQLISSYLFSDTKSIHNEFDISHLNSGVYIIKIISGESVGIQKIVVK